MNEQAALYRTILDRPEDDTPRLVYADWLQEHGQEARAEFIRVQCRIEALDKQNDPSVYDEIAALKVREQVLLETYGQDWLATDRKLIDAITLVWPNDSHGASCYRRGFPSAITINSSITSASSSAFTERLEAARKIVPVQSVRFDSNELHEAPEILDILASHPEITECVVNCTHDTTADDIRMLRESDFFKQLHSLKLSDFHTGRQEPQIAALTGTDDAPNLHRLIITGNISDYRNRDVCEASFTRHFPNLHTLQLSTVSLTGHHLQQLLSPTHNAPLPLHSLQLHFCQLNEYGMTTIAQNPASSYLRELSIIGEQEMALRLLPLTKSAHLNHLVSLQLNHANLSDGNVRSIIHSPLSRKLQALTLTSSHIRPEWIETYAESDASQALRILHVGSQHFLNEQVASALATAPHFKHLQVLSVCGARDGIDRPSEKDIATLANSPNLQSLMTLNLSGQLMSKKVAGALANATTLGNLHHLDIRGCNLYTSYIDAILNSPHLPNLGTVMVTGNSFDKNNTSASEWQHSTVDLFDDKMTRHTQPTTLIAPMNVTQAKAAERESVD